MYAGVGTFSITSLPCVRGCRGTHRTLYATLGTPPALSDLKASTRQRAGRQADSSPRVSSARVEQAFPRLGRPRTGQAGGHRLGPGGWGLAGGWGFAASTDSSTSSQEGQKAVGYQGDQTEGPSALGKEKAPSARATGLSAWGIICLECFLRQASEERNCAPLAIR